MRPGVYVDSKKQTRVLHRGRTAVVGEKSEWFDLYRRDRETIPSGVRSDAIWSISNSQNKYFYKKINKRLFGFLATDGETDENQLHDLCPRIEIRQPFHELIVTQMRRDILIIAPRTR